LGIYFAQGITQREIADKLCMDASCYNRREKGQARIAPHEWEKLADILDIPVDEIYEPDDNQFFICKDNASGNYQGTNHIYSIPEYLADKFGNISKFIVSLSNTFYKKSLKKRTCNHILLCP